MNFILLKVLFIFTIVIENELLLGGNEYTLAKLVETVESLCFIGGIDLVKISDEGIEEEYDECDDLPCLVHFKYGKPPVTFYGDLKEDEEVQQWIDVEISKKR